MTLIRRKEPGQAWETSVDGGQQTLAVYPDEATALAALGNGEWMVFYNANNGRGELIAKGLSGNVSGLVFEV